MTTTPKAFRYPRPGGRIAPGTLREFLLDPVPESFQAEPGSKLRLCDLDETAWNRFSVEQIDELAGLVVDRVAAKRARKAFQNCRLPRLAPGTRLEDLKLESRTHARLAREGFANDPAALGDQTIGQLLVIRTFGPRCLVDLLTALESVDNRHDHKSSDGATSAELTAAAGRLAELPNAELVHRADPRFADLMRAADVEAATAAELAQKLIARTTRPSDTPYVTEKVRQLHDRIEGLSRLTLEEELIGIFASTSHERNRRILIDYYGWEDGRQHTLTEVGGRFGITRERVRQVCAKATKKPKLIRKFAAPVMDRVLKLIASRLPCAAAQLEAELTEQGFTAVGMSIENVVAGAKLLERPVSFKIAKLEGKHMVVSPDEVDVATAIVDLAKKDLYFHGLATVARIGQLVSKKHPGASPNLVRQALQLIDGILWLDEPTGWFCIGAISKHGLPRAIDKILSIADEVTVSQMNMAMGRNRRLWKDPPPIRVLLEFCRRMPGVCVEGERIIAESPRDWEESLTGVELQLARVLKEHGPIMERGQMEDICVSAGMNRFSFHAFVSWSPVIEQFGHSLYGLLGTRVSQETIDEMLNRRRAERKPHRVLHRHGRTDDGKVWLSYRLSKAASTYAVITIPAAMKNVVHGRFQLVDPDGNEIGTLVTKDGRAWGLGAYLRRQGAAIEDYVLLTLDLQQHTALVSLGAEAPQ